MDHDFGTPSEFGLENHGLKEIGNVYWTLSSPTLIEHVAQREEGRFTDHGAIVVSTGSHTGRAPNDKFIVREGESAEHIWWGKVNLEFKPEDFDRLHHGILDHFKGRDLWVQNAAAGAQSTYQIQIRVITESAWHNLFARNIFRRLPPEALPDHVPQFTILHAPSYRADPKINATNSEVFIVLNFERGLVLIGGTSYAGEIKKSIFTAMNYLLPLQGVLSMHCSANLGQDGDVALFFGLSGTGKTTLSSDPERSLIGDDEHGWSDEGIFNFEGGCYAKTIRLSAEHEPIIWTATRRFGTVLENVVISDRSRAVDFDNGTLTENTRAGYPMEAVENHVPDGAGDHPKNVFFLTADAFGVMPPVARLSPDQAMYYFLSGYTSKLAGTEKGLGDEPQATFSACFGEPFLPLNPTKYAELLGERISGHKAKVWLINTGWTGGKFGVGERIHLPYTRAMVRAALTGTLDDENFHVEPFFGLEIPDHCPGVPDDVLDPRKTWDDPEAYDQQARGLATRFVANFERYAEHLTQDVVRAGPTVSVQ